MKQITAHDLTTMSEQAATVVRLRAHRTLHEELSDPVQRLAIAMEPGTYIRPHRHPQTWELLTPLRGRFVVLQFNDDGVVTQRTLLGEETKVLEMPASTWHAVLSVDPGGVVFEVKQGPYRALAEEDCMAWAPPEGGEGTAAVMRWYATAKVGDRFSPSSLKP
ncbi:MULTISPECIES: WbuC family cupin fold metalloprotein [unclassified Serratia (in: enterobacteria)]|uniref:WbuC family cupin fold metalloprotein n=1 Tax=unclassified Serratia (in: enterobacteria) TaxID=2647522 RepID=UPI00050569B9|nr:MULTISPECIES: WbuC family cupin fold metalloprotein [unclassified Serratia (in: enterobacteria)]KFK93645.1 protein WbuC [Serratia sp. Ag2]KFK98990.1 protein WbuC [Serratia sp. Ag1]